jgi:hypothetical protein
VLSDEELARVILAARAIDDRYGGIVELLALEPICMDRPCVASLM